MNQNNQNHHELIWKLIQALQDGSIDKDEAIKLMSSGARLLVELSPHMTNFWARRALDIAAITLREHAEKLERQNA